MKIDLNVSEYIELKHLAETLPFAEREDVQRMALMAGLMLLGDMELTKAEWDRRSCLKHVQAHRRQRTAAKRLAEQKSSR